MKLIEIVNAYSVVDALAQEDVVHTAKTSFTIIKFINSLSPDFKLYNEKRDELIRKYGKETEDGGYMIDKDDQVAIQSFIDEMDALGNLDIEDNFVKFDSSMLDEFKLSIKQAAALYPFIKE